MLRLTWTFVALGVLTVGTAPAAQVQNAAPAERLVQVQAALERVRVLSNNSVEHVMQRVLSFDVDGDTRIIADELPERMQDLVKRGDRNEDGYLAPDEIRSLISTERSRIGGALSVGSPDGLVGVVNDLRLPPSKRDQALAIVKGHTVPRIVNDPNSVEMKDVYAKMKELLDEDEYENFFAAATRLRRTLNIVVRTAIGGVPEPPPPPPIAR